MNTLIEVATAITGVLPNPEPEQPPGTEGVSTLINWLAWGALILGLAGFLASAGYLAFAAFTGREIQGCLLYTSPSPRDLSTSRMPSSA